MCGYAGFCALSKEKGDKLSTSLLEAMRQKVTHRGPDDHGVWFSPDNAVGFAHNRLSIIDISQAGKQPMLDKDESVVIAFNGEIYNHEELRKELESLGHEYSSHSDTETILHAYKQWGIKCLEKLDGMFSFSLFDIKKNELYLVRDRIGIKPLYFTQQNDILSFASEIKALWELPWNKREKSSIALYHYLTFMVTPAPYTIFQDVYKLPAGFYAKLDAQKNLSFHEWYSPLKKITLQEKKQFFSEQFCVENIRHLLINATKKRMMSDVPFGAFLSGGIDSSLNVALMSKFVGKVKTFTVAFSDGPEHDELKWARLVAERFGTDHHEIIISEKEAFQFYDKMVYHLDEPLADCVCIPFYYVAKLAKDAGVTVVQVGEGADELFFGYPTYAKLNNFYSTMWRPSQRVVPAVIRRGVRHVANKAFTHRLGYADLIDNWSRKRALFWGGAIAFNEHQKKKVLQSFQHNIGPDSMVEKIYQGMRQEFDSFSIVDFHLSRLKKFSDRSDFGRKMMYLELKQRLPELLLMRADKMAMAASVEARVPFLDYKLVEFMMHVPLSLKFKYKTTKYLLKRVAQGILPDVIVNRKKVGFAAPTTRWFTSGNYFPSYFDEKSSKAHSFFSSNVKNLKNLYRNSTSSWAVQNWVLQNLWALDEYNNHKK